MAEMLEETQQLESTTVGIFRTAAVVKGGRRFSFAALVVIGDRRGKVGIGYGKAPGVPAAIEKAQKDARKNITSFAMTKGTIPHPVTGIFGASKVRLVPAAPGTGVIAGGTVRAVLEMAGVRDCLTKCYGSTNQKNLCKAAIAGLQSLRTKEQIAQLRGVEIDTSLVEEKIALGDKYAPAQRTSDKPVKKIESKMDNKRGGRGGKGGRGRGGGGGGRGRGGGQAAAKVEAPAAEKPAAEAPAAEEKAGGDEQKSE